MELSRWQGDSTMEELRSFFLLLFMMLTQLPVAAAPGTDTIYALTDDDGSVSLSNVPTDSHYKALVSDGAPVAKAAESDAPPPVGHTPAGKARYDGLVEQTASAVGVEGALLHAVISVESGYDPSARSSAGAAGLMQLMPATAKRYGVVDALDPAQNLRGGAKYLRDLLKQYDSDISLAVAAYNAGEGAVAKYGNRIPPFSETTAYVPRVLAYYRKYQAEDQDGE
jgi:soluble lytic murein transglycosylase-like protein